MDYFELAQQHCPPAVVESVRKGVRGGPDMDDSSIFFDVTSTTLSPDCAFAVVGHMAEKLSPRRSPLFKSTFMLLARKYHADFAKMDGARYGQLQQTIGIAIREIIDEVASSQQRGSILGVLTLYRVNLLREIDARVDYKSLTQPPLVDWQLNEYAVCMNDPDAGERLVQVLAKSSAMDLRQLFSALEGQVSRGSACLTREQIAALARPYIRDARHTQDVNGKGPPVSTYARSLLDAL